MKVRWEAVFSKKSQVKIVKEFFEGDTLIDLYLQIEDYVNERFLEGWHIMCELVKDVSFDED